LLLLACLSTFWPAAADSALPPSTHIMSDEKRDYVGDEKRDTTYQPPPQPKINVPSPTSSVANNPVLPVLSYCASSILMTVTNKYVLSGRDFNLNFMLLAVQASCSLSTRAENGPC